MNPLFRQLWQFDAEAQGLVVGLTPEAETIVAGAEDGTLYAFDRSGRLKWKNQVDGEAFRLAINAAADKIAVGTIRGAEFSVLRLSDGQLLWSHTAGAQTKAGMAISADGQRLAGGADDGIVRLWDGDGHLLWHYQADHKKISRLSMTPNASAIVFGGNDHVYMLRADGSLAWRYRTGGEVWAGARITPDGTRIVAGSNDQHVYVISAEGSLIWRYRLVGNVNITAVTPDGQYIAAGSTDNHIYLFGHDATLLWKYRTGDSIYGLAISSDGQFIAAASYDRSIYLFNCEGDVLERVQTGHQVYCVDMDPTGRYLISFSFDKKVYAFENLFAANTDAEREAVRALVTQRVIAAMRRAFIDNTYYGLCNWFEQYNHHLRRGQLELCEALIAEARQSGYPLTASEQRFIESRAGAISLRRGILAHREGDFEMAARLYHYALETQRKIGCPPCANQAQMALNLLDAERISGVRDPLLDDLYAEQLVMGGSEALLNGRLATASAEDLPLIVQAAAKVRLIRPLLQAMKSDDVRVRMLAVATLNRFTDVRDMTPLLEALEDSHWFIRWQAAAALSRQKDLPETTVQRIIEYLARETAPEVKRVLIEMAAHLSDRSLTPQLVGHLADADADVRWSAVVALGKIGDRRALTALRNVQGGTTFFEMSIYDAAQRAQREIDQRYPLLKMSNWAVLRIVPETAVSRPIKLVWQGDALIIGGNAGNAADSTKMCLSIRADTGKLIHEVRTTFAEQLADTNIFRATLEAQAPRPSAEAPLPPTTDVTPEDDPDDDDDDEEDTLPTPPSGEQKSGVLWFRVPSEVTSRWDARKYSAVLLVKDEATGIEEQVASTEFTLVNTVTLRNARVVPDDDTNLSESVLLVEYAQKLSFRASNSPIPLNTPLRAEVWRSGDQVPLLVQAREQTEEGLTTLSFTFQQETWAVGDYRVRFWVREVQQAEIAFRVTSYHYNDWHSLPAGQDYAYLWTYLIPHLIKQGELEKLAATIKDLNFLGAKTVLSGTPAVENDLIQSLAALSTDTVLAVLQREYARISHIVKACRSAESATLTFCLWFSEIPELAPLCSTVLATQRQPYLARWLDLPTMHPALVRTLRGHTDTVKACVWYADGRYLATASSDATVKVWDVTTGLMRYSLRGVNELQTTLAVNASGRLLLSGGRPTVQVWDLETGTRIRNLVGHSGLITHCEFHADSVTALTVGTDGVRVWHVLENRLLRHFNTDSDEPMLAGFVGPYIFLVYVGESIHLMNLNDFQEVSTIEVEDKIIAAAATADGKAVAYLTDNSQVHFWEIEPNRIAAHQIDMPPSVALSALAVDSETPTLALGGADQAVRVWEYQPEPREQHLLRGHLNPIHGLAITARGQLIASGSEDKDVKVWSLLRHTVKTIAHPRSMPMWFGALSQDGSLIVTDEDKSLVLWDAQTGVLLRRFDSQPHSDEVLGCAISPNKAWVVSCAKDKTLKVWETDSGALLHTLQGHSNAIWRCDASPDGRWLVSASADATARVWETETWQSHAVLNGHTDQINGCAISPNSQWLATVSADGTVRVWSLPSGEIQHTLNSHGQSVLACAFSADSRLLATGGYDKRVKVWDVSSGEEIMTLNGHSHNVQSASFSPDGTLLLTGARNGGLFLWELSSGNLLSSLYVDRGVTNCAFYPDGQRVMVASGSGLYLLKVER